MLQKLGRRAIAAPVAIALVIACLTSIMFYPMAHLELRDVPFAALNLDEGVDTPQGHVNAGESLLDQLAGEQKTASSESGMPLAWNTVESEGELNDALERTEYYGALIVPDGFTAAQLQKAASAPGAEAMPLRIVIDQAKSPLVAMQLQTAMKSLFQVQGVTVDIEVIHEGANGNGANASPLSGMMGQQLGVAPALMMSIIGSIVLFLVLRAPADASYAARWRSLGLQVAYAVALSLVVALCECAALALAAGIEIPLGAAVPFFWLASFCIMLLMLGALNLALPLGVLVALCIFFLGMSTGAMPFEGLPAFWQNWVYPWAPQRFLGEGLRAMLYLGASAWNAGSLPLIITGCAGIALAVIAGVIPRRQKPDQSS